MAYAIDVQDTQERVLIKLDAAASRKSQNSDRVSGRINGWISMDIDRNEWI